MADDNITIAAKTITWTSPITTVALWTYATKPWVTAAGTPVNSSSPFDLQTASHPYKKTTCSVNTGASTCAVSALTLSSTEDAAVGNDVTLVSYFVDTSTGRIINGYSVFGGSNYAYRVPAAPASTTWLAIAENMTGGVPTSVGDKTVTGDLTVTGDVSIVGDLTITGQVAGDLHVEDDLFVGDDGDFGGTVTAASFVGSGAGLTGIATGTGGVTNTGSTTIGADTDSDGVGVIDLQTRAATRARVENDGSFKLFGELKFPDATRQSSAAQYASANVKEAPYYASGSATTTTTTGTNSSGATTINVTSSSGYSAGQGVYIAGAGAAGANYVGTVQSVPSGTSVQVTPAISTTVSAGAVVQHDDTDAINAAISAVVTAGGGRVFFPKGYYRVNKALNGTTNSVIYPPQNPWAGVGTASVPLALVGEVQSSWGDYGVLGGGVVIQSNVTGSGNFPAIFSAKVWAAFVDSTTQYQAWNYIHIHLENLLFRTYNNPSIGGVNLMKCHRASLRGVIADVGVTESTTPATSVSNPTSNVYGIAMPQVESNGMQSVEDCAAVGYQYGFYASDHFRAVGFVMAARCLWGYHFDTMAGMGAGHLYSYRNLHTFKFAGSINVIDFTVQMEVDTTSGGWNQATVGSTVDWEDTSDNAQGILRYKLASPGGVSDYSPTYTGMSQVDKRPIYNGKETTLTHAVTAAGALTFPSHIVADSVALVAGSAVVTFTGLAVFQSSSSYQVSGANFSNANPFKIVKNSGTQMTVTGTGTDIIMFIAVGK